MFRTLAQSVPPLGLSALVVAAAWGSGPSLAWTHAVATEAAVEQESATTQRKESGKPKKTKKRRAEEEAQAMEQALAAEAAHEAEFAPNAFPPVIPDTDWHQDAWVRDDCLRCHETGVGQATPIVHEGMAPILLAAKCRSCHVFIEGSPAAAPVEDTPSRFNDNAFPPMIPASGSHRTAWTKDDCLMCHESGIAGAPPVVHQGLPEILLTAKCRSCHVQVRSDEAAADW